jgi:hypothetical protein
MKIEHITYDQSHGARSTPQSSNSQRPTVLLTSRRRHHPEDKALPAAEERPVTTWPTTEATSTEPQPKMTTFLMLERRLGKEARKERSTPEHRDTEARRPRRNPFAVKAGTAATPPTPLLRRKLNFSETLRECLGSPKPEAQKQAENHVPITKIYTVREAIRAGKLEKAIPPPRSLGTDHLPVPPPRPQVPAAKLISTRVSNTKKPLSQPTKFGELVDRSADIFDETRKELVSKFMPPFEHLNYPSFTRSDRNFRRNSDVSDTSFYCIGEQESEHTQKVQGLKSTQQKNLQRKSYTGTDPWVYRPPGGCRLCRKPGVRGIRGLCNDCENDFIRPKTQKWEFVDSDEKEVEEIRPTPPLKDLQILTDRRMRQLGPKRKSVSHST